MKMKREELEKVINKQIISLILSSILISIIIIFMSYCLVKYILRDKIKSTYMIGDLTIEANNINNKELELLDDYNGIKSNKYELMVTNNGEDNINYDILLCGDIDPYKNIRISLNGIIIKDLYNLEYSDNCYILFKSNIGKETSYLYYVNMWRNSNEGVNEKVKYNIMVKTK